MNEDTNNVIFLSFFNGSLTLNLLGFWIFFFKKGKKHAAFIFFQV